MFLARQATAGTADVRSSHEPMKGGSSPRPQTSTKQSGRITISRCRSIVGFVAVEKSELRRVARRLGETEMAEGMRREQPPARRALDESLLNQKRLDDLLDRIARLR